MTATTEMLDWGKRLLEPSSTSMDILSVSLGWLEKGEEFCLDLFKSNNRKLF